MTDFFSKLLALLILLLLPTPALYQQHLTGFHALGLSEDDPTWDEVLDDEEDDSWSSGIHDGGHPFGPIKCTLTPAWGALPNPAQRN